MKFLNFASLLETEPANLAALSTFQFDPDFFERCLLRCSALEKARRILVFMDASQWFNLLRQDVQARSLNRKYLVVPVRPPMKGVFHPKLNLLVREDGGQIQCGSNNLTRSGCSSNLELLNSFSITAEKKNEESIRLAQEAFAFFRRACNDADQEAGRIAREWLDELPRDAPWLATEIPPAEKRSIRLVHTYEGSLWDQITSLLGEETPKRFFVISPFFDKEAELAQRIRQRWPKCQIEIIVQQKTTNLPVAALKKLGSSISLSELRNSSRRLHAKLLAWESPNGTGCLVGSANFTTAAFDGRNVETCLLVSDAAECVSSLFDGEFTKRQLAFCDFDPGTEQEPEAEDSDATTLRLTSALLTEAGELRVGFRHKLATSPSSLRLAIRTPGEQRPRAFLNLPNQNNGTTTLTPSESALKDTHGTILASLVAEVGDKLEESPPIWVIQESRLTYEPSAYGASSAKSNVEDSGKGLAEFLDELGKRDGMLAVSEYLRHLNIRFNDGENGRHSSRKFRLSIRDPFQADIAPDWLLNDKGDISNLNEAIYDFVDRHDNQRLRKHSKRGNINGMENFLDIFTALIKLLYRYYNRNIINRYKLIEYLVKFVQIAISGFENSDDFSEGFLSTVDDNLGSSDYLQKVCDELNFLGHVRAAFAILQRIRYIPGEIPQWGKPPSRASECLSILKNKIKKEIEDLGLDEPFKVNIINALLKYNMFSPSEMAEIEKEIMI